MPGDYIRITLTYLPAQNVRLAAVDEAVFTSIGDPDHFFAAPINLDASDLTRTSIPLAVNRAGQVVGRRSAPSPLIRAPFVWMNDVAIELPVPEDYTEGEARDISDSGQVVGTFVKATNGYRGFSWRDRNTNGVAESGEITVFEPLWEKEDGTFGWTSASAVNQHGQVAWVSTTSLYERAAYLWDDRDGDAVADDDEIRLLGRAPFSTPIDGVNDVNELGQVAAYKWEEGFVLGPGTATSLNPDWYITHVSVAPRAINNSGRVVGAFTKESGETRAFLWEDRNHNGNTETGELRDLGVLDGYVSSEATAVDGEGRVFGILRRDDGSQVAFRWSDGAMSEWLDPAVFSMSNVTLKGVSSHGHVFGTASFDGNNHGFILYNALRVGGPNGNAAIVEFDLSQFLKYRNRPKLLLQAIPDLNVLYGSAD